MKNYVLIAAIATLLACSNANGSSGNTNQSAQAEAVPAKADLGFLAKLGVDVSNIHTLGDPSDTLEYSDFKTLNVDQVLALVPMAVRTVDREHLEDWLEDCYDIVSARALPGGFTMLLFSVQTGDDSSNEMLGIYDKEGNLTDLMQVGDTEGFIVEECDEAFTQGTAQVTHIKFRFDKPNELTIDQTDEEGSWKDDGERVLRELVTVNWLVQTMRRYSIDDQGHLKLIEEKEVKREGKVAPEKDPQNEKNIIWNLSMLPMNDPDRVDRLNAKANEFIQKHGRAAFEEDNGAFVMAVEEYYNSNPEALLMWIYNHRNDDNVIAGMFKDLFVGLCRDKSLLVQDIEQLPDKTAKQYFKDLTSQWNPEQ